jgi:hypothetical protein
LNATHGNSKSLQLSSRQVTDFTIQDVIQFEIITHLRLVIKLKLAVQHLRDGEVTLDSLWDMIDILRLD